ncbi:MAG: class F sortase [Dehalococcoidia bacterium]
MTTEISARPAWWDIRQWNRLSIGLIVVGVTSLLAGGLFLIFGVLNGGSGYKGPGSAEAFGPGLKYFQAAPTAEPTPTAPPSGAAVEKLVIPKYGVEGSVVPLGVDSQGAMETPAGPWDVAWYDFTARPGFGSNAVFAGHVDALFTGNPGPAVFWHLKDLAQGDIIEVDLADGTVYRYKVISRWSVDGESADVGPIVNKTKKEVVTLITCGGDAGTSYHERLIVRAERIHDDGAASATVHP